MHVLLCMNNRNYMSNRNRFKDIGTFYQKKSFMPRHVTRNASDDSKNSEKLYTRIKTCLWSKPEVFILKIG